MASVLGRSVLDEFFINLTISEDDDHQRVPDLVSAFVELVTRAA